MDFQNIFNKNWAAKLGPNLEGLSITVDPKCSKPSQLKTMRTISIYITMMLVVSSRQFKKSIII